MFSINKNAIILILVLVTTFRVAAQDTIRNSNIALQDSIIDKTNDKPLHEERNETQETETDTLKSLI